MEQLVTHTVTILTGQRAHSRLRHAYTHPKHTDNHTDLKASL